MSNNEQSPSEDEAQRIRKNETKLRVENKSKNNKNNVSRKTNPYQVSERLYSTTTKSTKKSKNLNESNTDFNNKRFDKDKISIHNSVIKEENHSMHSGPYRSESLKKIVTKHSTGSGRKTPNLNPSQTRYKIDDHLRDIEKLDNRMNNCSINDEDEEEVVKNIPRPIDVHTLNSANKKLKVNDFRKTAGKPTGGAIPNLLNNNKNANNHMYMPDFIASKLVEDILQRRLNEN